VESALDADVVVIGGGAMGSAAAWHLAQRGRRVILLEQFEPRHKKGASHGRSRNFNLTYAQPEYVDLLADAAQQWRELEAHTGTRLLDQVGIVNHGLDGYYPAVAEALTRVGFDSEFVDKNEASRRWPGLRFESEVFFTPQGGRLDAEAAVVALQSAASDHGAVVRHSTRVRRVDVASDDRVSIEIDVNGATETLVARTVVVTVGAWTQKLVGGLAPIPKLVVTQEQPAHFAVIDESFTWPGFNHNPGARDDWWYSPIYGMLTPGEGIKAGWHGVGPVVDPDARDFTAEPVQLAALQRYAREWIPGADADSLVDISCTYTTTPDSNFVLDRVGPVVVGAGFSGHGFKFTPAIGRALADLADRQSLSSDFFSFR
jgi:sarcosine oxidase